MFDGHTLPQLGAGNVGSDRFTEYGRQSGNVSETLTVRSLSDQGPFDAKIAGRLPGYDAEAGRMMLSPGNQRGARR